VTSADFDREFGKTWLVDTLFGVDRSVVGESRNFSPAIRLRRARTGNAGPFEHG